MKYFRRALKYLTSNNKKVLALVGILFLLTNLLAGAIYVRRAIEQIDNNLRDRIPAIAVIDDTSATSTLSPYIIRDVGGLPYVRVYDYSFSHFFYTTDLILVEMPGTNPEIGLSRIPVEGLNRLIARGIHNPYLIDIQEDLIHLNAGRTFTYKELAAGGVAIISEELANLNQLSIGSTFTLSSMKFDLQATGGAYLPTLSQMEEILIDYFDFELEVIGIFEVISSNLIYNNQIDVNQMEMLINRIYVPNIVTENGWRFENVHGDEESSGDIPWMDPIFIIEDPVLLSYFVEAANELLPDDRQISDISSAYERIFVSMESINWIAFNLMISAVVAIIIIINLLLILYIRDRRYEFGIYLALGEKKHRIILQILVEVFIASFIAIILALFTSPMLAEGIGRQMFENDLMKQMNGDTFTSWLHRDLAWFDPVIQNEEVLEMFDINMNRETLVIFSLTSMGSILVSTIIPLIYMVSLRPKKILM